jgi:hypothetical protein
MTFNLYDIISKRFQRVDKSPLNSRVLAFCAENGLGQTIILLSEGPPLLYDTGWRRLKSFSSRARDRIDPTHVVLMDIAGTDVDGFPLLLFSKYTDGVVASSDEFIAFSLKMLEEEDRRLWQRLRWGIPQAASTYRYALHSQKKPTNWYLIPHWSPDSKILIWGEADPRPISHYPFATKVTRQNAERISNSRFDGLIINAGSFKSCDEILDTAACLGIKANHVVSGLDTRERRYRTVDCFFEDLSLLIKDRVEKHDNAVITFSRRSLVEANYTSYYLQKNHYNLIGYTWNEKIYSGGCLYGNKMSIEEEDYGVFHVDKVIRLDLGQMEVNQPLAHA